MLNTLRTLHLAVVGTQNIKPESVKSLVSESFIEGREFELLIQPLVENEVATQSEAKTIQAQVTQMTPFIGTIVSDDFSSLAIVAEVYDQHKTE